MKSMIGSLNYYTSIIFLSVTALFVMCILVHENGRIKKEDKKLLYLTYLLIALSALVEWNGLLFDGVETLPKWPLMVIKCADYILTPMAGGILIKQMNIRNRWSKLLLGLLATNAIFQVVACFGGWMVKIDEHNHYTHGPLYIVYILIYMLVIGVVVVEFARYGKEFHRQNRKSLHTIMAFIIVWVLAQELLGNDCRTAYIALTIGAILLFIHYSEFSQMASDERLKEQKIKISTDELTGTLNRYAYAKAIAKYKSKKRLPEDLCVFSIDINGLKKTNDIFGHAVGDELICGASDCINRVFGETAKCFRIGGDEFIVFARLKREQADEALANLADEASSWTGNKIKELHLATGYALLKDYPDYSLDELVIEADCAMYSAKNNFYHQSGEDT